MSLWALFTHCIDCFDIAPILGITSPEKRCGKTRVLNWLNRIVRRPLLASNVTSAVIYRVAQDYSPTLLIDEADTFLNDNKELGGVINSGHTRESAYVLRNDAVGNNWNPKKFSTWGARAIAKIGAFNPTLADRAIELKMRRRLPNEQIEKLRRNELDSLRPIASRCARFAVDNTDLLKNVHPLIPDSLHDRAADNWEPLLAIAELANDEWRQKAIAAAITISGIGDMVSESITTKLLSDIRVIFDDKKATRIFSCHLLDSLYRMPDSPWSAFNKGKPLTGHQLAGMMRDFEVTANQTVRIGESTQKGYKLEDFQDAFSRYLIPPLEKSHGHMPVRGRVSGQPQKVTKNLQKVTRSHDGQESACDVVTEPEKKVTERSRPEASQESACDVVTFPAPPGRGDETQAWLADYDLVVERF